MAEARLRKYIKNIKASGVYKLIPDNRIKMIRNNINNLHPNDCILVKVSNYHGYWLNLENGEPIIMDFGKLFYETFPEFQGQNVWREGDTALFLMDFWEVLGEKCPLLDNVVGYINTKYPGRLELMMLNNMPKGSSFRKFLPSDLPEEEMFGDIIESPGLTPEIMEVIDKICPPTINVTVSPRNEVTIQDDTPSCRIGCSIM